ncbi:hypothetical protein CABS03_00236, partial [Colletotrichum abscissum]
VIGQECGSVVITSQADADALRNCPEIFGNVTVIAGASAQEIALEGVKVIHGDLVNVSQCPQVSAQCIGYNHNITSISSSTITRVNGSMILAYDGWISGLSFPELQSVGENFVLNGLESLKYLDVDRLESMELGLGGLESLDAFFKEPQLGVDDVSIYNSGKVKRLQIGAAKIGKVKFAYSTSGMPNNLTLVLGGSGITEQTIGSIQTTYSLNGIERLVNLKTLSAEQWEDFSLDIGYNLNLNLSTEYRVSEKGEMIRSCDSYFEFRNKLSKEALANRTEYLQIYAEGSFSCEPFDKLEEKASGRYHVVCSAQDRIDLRSGGLVQAEIPTFGWIVAGVIVITGIISV